MNLFYPSARLNNKPDRNDIATAIIHGEKAPTIIILGALARSSITATVLIKINYDSPVFFHY